VPKVNLWLVGSRLARFAIGGPYWILFGWWLHPLMSRRAERRLKEETRTGLAFLFDDHGAKFVPNDRVPLPGRVITLEAGGFRFEIWHGRGEYEVYIAPLHAPMEWQDITLALMVINASHPIRTASDMPARSFFNSLPALSRVLQPQFDRLMAAYSVANYPATKQALSMAKKITERDMWAAVKRDAQLAPFGAKYIGTGKKS
jgi:hypothetical protein